MSAPSPPPRRPRRHSRRRYAVRRAVAVLILVLAGFGIVQAVRSVVTDGDPVADGATQADPPTSPAGSAATGDPADSGPPVSAVADNEPDATDPPEPDTTGPATPQNPAKVFIVGDSDAGTFGPYLQTLLDGTGVVTTELDYKVSSGLARPDFFDWPAEIDAKLPEVDPDIVVATFGGNDAQGLSVANGDFIVGDPVANEAEWVAEYSKRAGAVMDQLRADGRTVIWVGIPNDDNPDVTARMAIQDKAARAAAAERPDVIFIDTWKRFSGRTGGWAEFVIDPRDGEGKDVRADDGFHLNQTGAEILAIDIAQAIRDTLRADGAQI